MVTLNVAMGTPTTPRHGWGVRVVCDASGTGPGVWVHVA